MTQLLEELQKPSRKFVIVFGYVSLVVLGVTDYLLGYELSFSVFYLLPVSLLSWSIGRKAGLIMAVASAVTWLAAELLAGATYSFPLIPIWNMAVRLGFFVIVAFLLSGLKGANDRLRESEERFRQLSDATVEGIVIHDRGKIVDTNRLYTAMLGFEPGEMVGMDVLELTAPQSRDLVRRSIAAGYKGTLEVSLLRKDGSTFPAEVNVRTFSYHGRLVRVAACRDLTIRKEMEEKLAHERNLLKTITDNLPDPIYLKDVQSRFLMANEAVAQLMGVKSSSELIGKTDLDFLPAQYAKRYYADEQAIVKEGRPLINKEEEALDSLGNKRWMLTTKVPLYNSEGQIVAIVGMNRDITSRKEAEIKLQEAVSLLTATLESTADGILVVDHSGRIVKYNERFTTMWRLPAEILETQDDNKAVAFVLDQLNDPELFVSKIRDLYAHPDAESFDTLEFKDGRLFERYSLPEKVGGQTVGRVWSFRDITERKRAEVELKSVMARLQEAQETAHIGSWEWDVKHNVVRWSDELFRLFGLEPGQTKIDYDTYLNLLHPEERDWVDEIVRKAFIDHQPFQFDHRVVLADGSVRWLHGKGQVFVDTDGTPIRMAGTAQDVTDRKRAEAVLRVSEERYRTLVESVESIIYTVSPDGIIKSLNTAFETVTGWSREDWIGKSFAPLVHPDDLESAWKGLKDAYTNERPKLFQVRARRKMGDYINVEFTSAPLIQDGKIVSILGIVQDITERKRAEDKLRASEERYRSLFNQSRDVIYITTPSGKILDINPAGLEVFGYPSKEDFLKLENVRDLYVDPSDRMKFQSEMKEHGFLKDYEWVLKKRDGTPLIVSGTVSPLLDDAGNLVGYLGISREVTKEKELQRLQQREKELQLLARARVEVQEAERRRISREIHDSLGQVLTAVRFNVDVIEDLLPLKRAEDKAKLREIKTLLEQAVTEAREISYNLMPSVLDDFGLTPALDLLCSRLSKSSGLNVAFYVHDLLAQRGEEKRLEPSLEIALYRVAQESLTNALKHSEAKEITVQFFRDASSVRMTIEDDGKGFTSQDILSRGKDHGGMGLASIRERVSFFNGSVRIDSAPGKGAQVLVEIPLVSTERNGKA